MGNIHGQIPAIDWHGSRFTGGLAADRGAPEILGQVYWSTDTDELHFGKIVGDSGSWEQIYPMPGSIIVEQNSTTYPGINHIEFPVGFVTDDGGGKVTIAGLEVEEPGDTPTIPNVKRMVFPDGTLSSPGAGEVVVNFPVNLTVEEQDGTPSVSEVTEILVPNGSLTDNGGGSISINLLANLDYAIIGKNVSQIIDNSAGFADITWDVETSDTPGWFDLGTDDTRFTASVDGVYQHTISIYGYGNVPNVGMLQCMIQINGVDYRGHYQVILIYTTAQIHVVFLTPLIATDYVQFGVHSNDNDVDLQYGTWEVIKIS